jgi:hypothetical protein
MPPESDVRDGVIFGQASDLEGTLDLPPESAVEDGYTYDNGTKTGSLPAPDADDLRLGVVVGSITGTVRVPTAEKVKVGELFEANDLVTGTYDGSERYTDVPEGFVVAGFDFRFNSMTNNREGNLDVAGQVWNSLAEAYEQTGSFGEIIGLLKNMLQNITNSIQTDLTGFIESGEVSSTELFAVMDIDHDLEARLE